MKLSKNTLTILKNFSGISNSLRIRPGNIIMTCNESQTLVAKAVLEESFECDAGIYDLSQFLGACSIMEDPDIEFTAETIELTDKKKTIRIPSGSIKVVKGPEKFPKLADPIVAFPYTNDLHSNVTKAAGILVAPDFCIVGDGTDINLSICNTQNSSASSFKQRVGGTDKVFNAITKVDGLKLVPGDYEAILCDKRMIVFHSQDLDLIYCNGVLPNSTFEW